MTPNGDEVPSGLTDRLQRAARSVQSGKGPSGPDLRARFGRRRDQRRLSLGAGLVIVVVVGVALTATHIDRSHRQRVRVSQPVPSTARPATSVPTPSTSVPASATSVPASARKCVVPGGTFLPGYVGLTYRQATELARAEGDRPFLTGYGGQCGTRLSIVAASPVDIVLGDSNRVVAAECEYRNGAPCGHDPLSRTAKATLKRLLSNFGWSDLTVGAIRTTYGQAHHDYLDLAASTAIPSGQPVWVVTAYYPKAQTMVTDAGWGPPTSHQSLTTTVYSQTVVINATSSVETDYCTGCALIPPNEPATTSQPSAPASTPPGRIDSTLILPTTTIRTGHSVPATIIVSNETGHSVRVSGCGSFWQVLLVSRQAPGNPVWSACAQFFSVPVGPSDWPVTVETDLAPGAYQATTYELGSAASIPIPQRVLVTR